MPSKEMEQFILGEVRVMRAIVEENSDSIDRRYAAIRSRCEEAELERRIARDKHWVTNNSGPDYLG